MLVPNGPIQTGGTFFLGLRNVCASQFLPIFSALSSGNVKVIGDILGQSYKIIFSAIAHFFHVL